MGNGVSFGVRSQGDEDGRVIVVEVATKSELDLLDVLPSVAVRQGDLRRVRHAGMQRGLVVMADDGGICSVKFGLELLADGVCYQVSVPIRGHLSAAPGTAVLATKVLGTDGTTAHGHHVVLSVFPADVVGHSLPVNEHRIVDAGFKDVQATGPDFWGRHGLEFVFFCLRQAVEVVVRASNGLTGLASKPVMEADLVRWIH